MYQTVVTAGIRKVYGRFLRLFIIAKSLIYKRRCGGSVWESNPPRTESLYRNDNSLLQSPLLCSDKAYVKRESVPEGILFAHRGTYRGGLKM